MLFQSLSHPISLVQNFLLKTRTILTTDPIKAPSNKPLRLPPLAPSTNSSENIITVPSYVKSDIPCRCPSVVQIRFPYHTIIALPSSVPSSSTSRDTSHALGKNPSWLPSEVPSVEPSKNLSTVPSYKPRDKLSRDTSFVNLLATYLQGSHMQSL